MVIGRASATCISLGPKSRVPLAIFGVRLAPPEPSRSSKPSICEALSAKFVAWAMIQRLELFSPFFFVCHFIWSKCCTENRAIRTQKKMREREGERGSHACWASSGASSAEPCAESSSAKSAATPGLTRKASAHASPFLESFLAAA